LMKLNPVISLSSNGKNELGFLNNEVKNIIPELVFDDGEKVTLSETNMLALITLSIKQQQYQIASMSAQLNELNVVQNSYDSKLNEISDNLNKSSDNTGIDLLTNKILGLNDQIASLSSLISISTESGIISTDTELEASKSSALTLTKNIQLAADTVNVLGTMTVNKNLTAGLDMTVMGNLTTNGSLIVYGPGQFKAETVFEKLAQFINNVIFKGEVSFEGRPTFNKDTAGFAVIRKGERKVDVVYDKQYANNPIVTANILWDIDKDTASITNDLIGFYIPKWDYVIAASNTKGFSIILEEPAVTDLKFNWVAVAVKDAKTDYSATTSGSLSPSIVPISPVSITPTPPLSTPTTKPIDSSPQPTVQITINVSPTTIFSPTPTIAPIDSITPTIQASRSSSKTLTVVSTDLGFVRMRTDPDVNSTEIDQIPAGTVLSYTDTMYGWYNVQYLGKTGWISGTYVEINQ
jgi:hypothetical protein